MDYQWLEGEQEDSLGGFQEIPVRDGGALDQGSGGGGSEKWQGLRFIPMIRPTGSVDGLHVGRERKTGEESSASVTAKTEFPLTEMGKSIRGTGFVGRIRSSVLAIIGLRC